MHRRQVRFVCRGRLPKLPSPQPHTRAPVHLLLRWSYVDIARLLRPSPPAPPLLQPPLPRVQFFVRHRGFHTSVLHNESFHTRESLYIIIHSIAQLDWCECVQVNAWLLPFPDRIQGRRRITFGVSENLQITEICDSGFYDWWLSIPLEKIVSAVLSDYMY